MTTIAFDGRVLAVDGAASSGSLWIHGVKKIRRGLIPGRGRREYVVAFTGDSFFCSVAADAIFAGEELPDPSPYGYNSSQSGVLAVAAQCVTGKCWIINPLGDWLPVKAPVTAGAGAEFALGALVAGATARRAILLAHKYTDSAAGGVSSYMVR